MKQVDKLAVAPPPFPLLLQPLTQLSKHLFSFPFHCSTNEFPCFSPLSVSQDSMNSPVSKSKTRASTPSLSAGCSSSSSSSGSETDDSPFCSQRFSFKKQFPTGAHRCLAVLAGHVGSISCLALCGEFILSASQGTDIIVWQQPDLRLFAKFGHGDGSVKALTTVANKVFTAHQDSRIRVWKLSRSSENVFKLVHTLPTTKDYLGKFMKQSNYLQTRRHHRRLWIQHADSISCLTDFWLLGQDPLGVEALGFEMFGVH